GEEPDAVARAAYEGARTALSETTGQLDVLRRAGVVDAGGSGLVAVLGALADALTDPGTPLRSREILELHGPPDGGPSDVPGAAGPEGGPSYEVMYLLESGDAAVAALRERLDGLGDSLVVGGGDGLWSVHVHVDDAGAAVEAGIGAGRPYRVRITHLSPETHGGPCAPASAAADADEIVRAVVAVVHGDGLAGLCEEAGAVVLRAKAGEKEAVDSDALLAAVRATGAHEVVLLPNDTELHRPAARAAEAARGPALGVRVAVVPTRAAVQGIAALAVHQPDRRFDEDVVAMTAAAGATRYGEVTFAEHRAWTMAGVCQAGDVLGLVEGDVAVIGGDVTETAVDVLERMLAAGGEMVTLVLGEGAPQGLAERLAEEVRRGHLAVDTVVHEGRQHSAPLLIGVE
ncbi:MAG: DAK2 domain-containing protein, partial [Streptomyces sp.]|uniref:DAK2 domain-containing protein n=1 Tax=Streptomyces sp. TaxID=1931 RepID=UPI003D6AA30A